MNKKNIIFVSIVVLVLIAVFTIIINSLGTVKNPEIISDLKDDSFLDIIVNLSNYSANSYEDENLLDVSMQIAEKLGLMNESYEEDYIQYVSGNDLHSIIYELTGNTVEAPIEIEDFYYLYDSEHEYYFYRPASPAYYSVKEISSVKEKGSNYTIVCSIEKTEDFETNVLENVKIKLTYVPENTFVKYKVDTIKIDS